MMVTIALAASLLTALADVLGLSRILMPPLAVILAVLPGANPAAGVGVGESVAVAGRVAATVGVGVVAGGRVTVAAAAASRLT